jgi:hypothetical protein
MVTSLSPRVMAGDHRVPPLSASGVMRRVDNRASATERKSLIFYWVGKCTGFVRQPP